MAQRAHASHAPAPDGSISGEGDAVASSCHHAHGALAAQRRREDGRRVEPRHALAVAKEAWDVLRRTAARREPPLADDEEAVPMSCGRPRRRVGLAQKRRVAQPPHGAALALWQRRQLEAALLRPQADALQRKRGIKEQRDGRDASDVGGVAARDGSHEELRGEVEAARLARERRWGWRRGGASCGAAGWTSRRKEFTTRCRV